MIDLASRVFDYQLTSVSLTLPFHYLKFPEKKKNYAGHEELHTSIKEKEALPFFLSLCHFRLGPGCRPTRF